MTYFVPTPKTAEELKKAYRRLIMANHPDKGGSEAAMKAINAEYERLFERLKNVHTAADGTEYTAAEGTTETAAEFIDIINRLIVIPDIGIEICGRWIWISGNTYAAREELKAAGCKFASKKKMWYWHRDEDFSANRRTMSMDKIRELHGSEVVTERTAARTAIA